MTNIPDFGWQWPSCRDYSPCEIQRQISCA